MIFLATGLPWQCLIYKNKQKLLWVNFHKQLNISHDWPNIRKSRISVIFFCLTNQSVFMCVQIFSDIHMNVYKTRIKSGRCMSLVDNRETESEKKWQPNVFFFFQFFETIQYLQYVTTAHTKSRYLLLAASILLKFKGRGQETQPLTNF